MRKTIALLIAGSCITLIALAAFGNILPKNLISIFNQSNVSPSRDIISVTEGPTITATITAGPFDLHRRYRSMEGPYLHYEAKIADCLASKNISLPESMVSFVENDGAASMNGDANKPQKDSVTGLVKVGKEPRQLYWLKGMKLEVLDEHDQVLPTAEFICHFNLDTDSTFRNKIFPYGEPCVYSRLVTITQGQTEICFPKGYAVPVASDEVWNLQFQAANRTTDQHRRIKHRCTMYFVKDSQLVYPITALNWSVPFVRVITDGNSKEVASREKLHCPSCIGFSPGVSPSVSGAHNEVDGAGRHFSGHWVIPPGVHTYNSLISDFGDPGFASKDRIIHAVWSHLHPLCTSFSLYKCLEDSRQQIFCVHEQTKTSPGLEIQNIDYISSEDGIPITGGNTYELGVTYDNTTGQPQDSMATAGIFFENMMFVRPKWVYSSAPEVVSCLANNKCVK